jgi:hypothetical protein
MSASEITYSHARTHLSEVLDRVGHDRPIITVTRCNQPEVSFNIPHLPQCSRSEVSRFALLPDRSAKLLLPIIDSPPAKS